MKGNLWGSLFSPYPAVASQKVLLLPASGGLPRTTHLDPGEKIHKSSSSGLSPMSKPGDQGLGKVPHKLWPWPIARDNDPLNIFSWIRQRYLNRAQESQGPTSGGSKVRGAERRARMPKSPSCQTSHICLLSSISCIPWHPYVRCRDTNLQVLPARGLGLL